MNGPGAWEPSKKWNFGGPGDVESKRASVKFTMKGAFCGLRLSK